MKRMITSMILGIAVLMVPMPVLADDYTFSAVDMELFGTPTSIETVLIPVEEPVNTDRSKNAAYIPPVFGSATSYLRNSGERLTPNLVDQNWSSQIISNVGNGVIVMPPSVNTHDTVVVSNNDDSFYGAESDYTEVTSSLYYANGRLGQLEIPAIDLKVNIYQGTDNATLRRGVGHFEESSIWSGNVALAAHNRGANNYFGKIHTLQWNDEIKLTTKLGVKIYQVKSVSKIAYDNTDVLNPTSDNRITLVTCVRDQPTYRWCVQAVEK